MRSAAVILAFLSSTVVASGTNAAQYRVTEITMPPGLTGAIPTALSNSGDVTLIAGKPVVWSEHKGVTVLPDLIPFDLGTAWGVNAEGKVVGSSANKPVLWKPDGTLVDLLAPPRWYGEARSINDRGQVVGRYIDIQNYVAFLWEENKPLVAIPPIPGGHDGWAMDVNNLGQVVGRSDFRAPCALTSI
jgi:uncharacterized membrane protein